MQEVAGREVSNADGPSRSAIEAHFVFNIHAAKDADAVAAQVESRVMAALYRLDRKVEAEADRRRVERMVVSSEGNLAGESRVVVKSYSAALFSIKISPEK